MNRWFFPKRRISACTKASRQSKPCHQYILITYFLNNIKIIKSLIYPSKSHNHGFKAYPALELSPRGLLLFSRYEL